MRRFTAFAAIQLAWIPYYVYNSADCGYDRKKFKATPGPKSIPGDCSESKALCAEDFEVGWLMPGVGRGSSACGGAPDRRGDCISLPA
jgi:hypothetical protein